jgi:hypothetical protein
MSHSSLGTWGVPLASRILCSEGVTCEPRSDPAELTRLGPKFSGSLLSRVRWLTTAPCSGPRRPDCEFSE